MTIDLVYIYVNFQYKGINAYAIISNGKNC